MRRVGKTRSLLLILTTLFAVAGVAVAQDPDMVGTWTVYRIDELSNYTMRDYTAGRTDITTEGTLLIETDGQVTAEGLDFSAWRMEDSFFVLENAGGNHFFAVRPVSADVYFLTNLTVTERNREVTHIRVNRTRNLLVVRE